MTESPGEPQQPHQPPLPEGGPYQHYGQDPTAYYGQPADPYGTPPPSSPAPYASYGPPVPHAAHHPAPGAVDTTAIVSLVLGVGAWVGSCFYGIGLLLGPPALITGMIANRRIARSGGSLTDQGFAVGGIVLGAIATIALVAVIGLAFFLLTGPPDIGPLPDTQDL